MNSDMRPRSKKEHFTSASESECVDCLPHHYMSHVMMCYDLSTKGNDILCKIISIPELECIQHT